MIARIQKAIHEKEKGFTLIELLVVIIIIGILSAIAIPLFLNQRKKAEDAAAKADVATIGKEIATWFVDNTAAPVVTETTDVYYLATAASVLATDKIGNSSTNVDLGDGFQLLGAAGSQATTWCIDVTNASGTATGGVIGYKYSAAGGLEKGTC